MLEIVGVQIVLGLLYKNLMAMVIVRCVVFNEGQYIGFGGSQRKIKKERE